MGYLALGIIIGITIDRYVFKLLDLLAEYFSVRISEKASVYQGKMQLLQFKLESKCSATPPAIGFSMTDIKDNEEEETEEDEDQLKSKKIGFKL
jgi:hypothetical protein